jgi:hypothetical protein
MRSQVSGLILLAAFTQTSCLLPGSQGPSTPATAGFFEDYSLLRASSKVRQAYLNPEIDLRSLRSVRIPDFANYTGRALDPQALTLAAEALTSELELLPPSRRPFQLIDRSPRTAAGWVDVLLEGAITTYEVKTETTKWSRLSDQVVVGIECRLIESRTGRVVALIQHRRKRNLSETGYDNPVREVLQQIGRDMADFLAAPDELEESDDEDQEQDGEAGKAPPTSRLQAP